MKVSELIEALAKIITQHGDLLAFPASPDGMIYPEACGVMIHTSESGASFVMVGKVRA